MIHVVMPSHLGDSWLCLKNLKWQYELCGQQPNSILLVCDPAQGNDMILAMQIAAGHAYTKTRTYCYPTPLRNGWPQACNWIFQHTARYMQQFGEPWLFLEPDAVPIKSNWLQILEKEYARGGKPFMGPIVPDFGHCNGVAVYHPNTPQMLSLAMAATDYAWDCAAAPEMVPRTHRANDIIQHCWGIRNGQIVPYDGEPMKWSTQDSLRTILPTACVVHRDKSGSLIDRYREQRNQPLSFCVPALT